MEIYITVKYEPELYLFTVESNQAIINWIEKDNFGCAGGGVRDGSWLHSQSLPVG